MNKLNRDRVVTTNIQRYLAIVVYNGARTFILTIGNLLSAVAIGTVSLKQLKKKRILNLRAWIFYSSSFLF